MKLVTRLVSVCLLSILVASDARAVESVNLVCENDEGRKITVSVGNEATSATIFIGAINADVSRVSIKAKKSQVQGILSRNLSKMPNETKIEDKKAGVSLVIRKSGQDMSGNATLSVLVETAGGSGRIFGCNLANPVVVTPAE